MLDTSNPLVAEFLKDHQQMSRLLLEISTLLNTGKIDLARQRATELDAVAGPHIAYEEAELYPRLDAFGEKAPTQEKLVAEHHEAVASLRRLLNSTKLGEDQLRSIQAGFNGALKHVDHCGTLISLLTQLEGSAQTQSLEVLLRLREQGKKWTEL